MNFLERAMRGFSRRDSTWETPDQWLTAALTGGKTYSGKAVNVSTALGLAPFYRGVQLLSGSVGMLPCKVYAKRGTDRIEQPTSRPWELLHDKPNADMAADEFWALIESHIDTWGNAFVWKERGPDERISNLWPLSPSRVAVGKLTGEQARRARVPEGTRYFTLDGKTDDYYFEPDILHVRGLSSDGLRGYSPVQVHRQSLGSALARDEFGGRFWENDATPGVTLIHPGKLQPDAINRIRELWDARHKGGPNRRKTAVLAEAITVQQMTMPLKDAQYIEGQRMDATTQALILGIPPYMVAGDTGGSSLTYSTVEGQAVDFLKWSLSPRLVRLQKAFSWDPDLMPSNWFCEFETGGILRSTTKERYEAWSIAPHLTVNEMRAMDNLPPIEGGDELSKSAAVSAGPPAIQVGGTPEEDGDDDGD